MHSYLLCILFLLGQINIGQAAPSRDFTADSYRQILDARQGKPLVMVFWSVDCAPCHKELAMLGAFKQQQPQFDLVLIATDDSASRTELQTVLAKHRLDQIDTWVFAGDSAEAIRYAVDPTWYGELPRSYLFNQQHQRQAVSGLLSAAVLQAWLSDLRQVLQ